MIILILYYSKLPEIWGNSYFPLFSFFFYLTYVDRLFFPFHQFPNNWLGYLLLIIDACLADNSSLLLASYYKLIHLYQSIFCHMTFPLFDLVPPLLFPLCVLLAVPLTPPFFLPVSLVWFTGLSSFCPVSFFISPVTVTCIHTV